MPNFFEFVTEHWQFCLLHFLQFGTWGAWFVVLGNILETRGFSRGQIGRIYATIPIGTMVAALVVGALVDRYFNTEVVLAVSHLVGAALLLAMSMTYRPWPFYGLALAYGIAFAPTLNLVNSIVFVHDDDIFGGQAEAGFPWIRVFGTIGWIVAGLSHALILKKGQPINGRPLLLAAGISAVLGLFCLTLPATPPSAPEGGVGIIEGMASIVGGHPLFFGVTFVAAMAMGLYFAFSALFLEKTGVPSRVVGPVMTIGQAFEVIFILTLPLFLGVGNKNMFWVLLIGVSAWALRFGLFAIGRPLALVLVGVAIHGVCFDFFFVAGFIQSSVIAPEGLAGTAQSIYGFLVYGVGMFLGSELGGFWNSKASAAGEGVAASAAPSTAPDSVKVPADGTGSGGDPYRPPAVAAKDGSVEIQPVVETDWRKFWILPCILVAIAAVLFGLMGRV